ncbi:hypothetical protein [Shewanella xiamenensis]|nr:hypothetical protein [Shewanella xiamenensis]
MSAYQKAASTLNLQTFVDGLHHPEQINIFNALGYRFGQGSAIAHPFTLVETLHQVCA